MCETPHTRTSLGGAVWPYLGRGGVSADHTDLIFRSYVRWGQLKPNKFDGWYIAFVATSMGTSALRDVPFVLVSVRPNTTVITYIYADAVLMSCNKAFKLLLKLAVTDITPF
ncbi:hypothetical protein PGB90_002061 [Kerria lacca]